MVYYGRHSADDGNWELHGEYPVRTDGVVESPEAPIVYSSYHSHGNYDHTGRHTERPYNPDFTSADGVQWDTSVNVVNIGERKFPTPGNKWMEYVGRWGELHDDNLRHPAGPGGPTTKSQWDEGDEEGDFPEAHAGPVISKPADQTSGAYLEKWFSLGTFTDALMPNGPWTVTVRWGDGTYDRLYDFPQNPQSVSYPHTYTVGGTKNVSVDISNGITANSTSFGVTVAPQTITYTPPATQSTTINTAQVFSLGSFTESSSAATSWTVSVWWGDGSSESIAFSQNQPITRSHTYTTYPPNRLRRVDVLVSNGTSGHSGRFLVNVADRAANRP